MRYKIFDTETGETIGEVERLRAALAVVDASGGDDVAAIKDNHTGRLLS